MYYKKLIGTFIVEDEQKNTLMVDSGIYQNWDDFFDVLVKKFRYNQRFKWLEAIYHRKTNYFEFLLLDAGRGKIFENQN